MMRVLRQAAAMVRGPVLSVSDGIVCGIVRIKVRSRVYNGVEIRVWRSVRSSVRLRVQRSIENIYAVSNNIWDSSWVVLDDTDGIDRVGSAVAAGVMDIFQE